MINFLVTILVGAVSGWLASLIMHKNYGWIITIVLGILGGFVGGLINTILGGALGGWVGGIVVAVAGSCLLIWLFDKIKK